MFHKESYDKGYADALSRRCRTCKHVHDIDNDGDGSCYRITHSDVADIDDASASYYTEMIVSVDNFYCALYEPKDR